MILDTKENNIGKNLNKRKRHPIVNFMLFLTLISSILYFLSIIIYKENDLNIINLLISVLLLFIFTIFFILMAIKSNNKKKNIIFISSFFLTLYNVFGILTTTNILVIPNNNKVVDFSNKSLSEVVLWASKNNITLNQEYEYNDMIPEYNIIFQNKKAGTSIKKIKELTVSVSEGPSPYKEVIVPDMTTWDSDRVLSFINKNYLSNISLEFVNSDKEKNTVIEQDKKGNLKRNDEIKLTFSYGEEEINEVNLSNLCGKSKFEALFYLKQNKINFEIKEDFSNSVKRGYVMSQDIKPGKLIKVSDDKVVLTISKGKKIKVPNLVNMSVTEITNWIIKNRLKLEFTDKYDDKIKDNKVISANYKKGDIIEQGSTVNIVISKGKLVMPKFSSIVDFYEWADKYSIKYEEKHEYSDTVAIGEVIKYSVSSGKTIKNDEVITVVISDGKECSVPNIIGLSKSDAISKLKRANLGYNFVYQNSNKVLKDKVISQSISAGSKVSSGTTITVIISNGKKEVTSNNSSSKNNNSSSNGNNSSNNNSNNNNSGGSNNTCVSKTYTVSGSIRNIFNNSSGYSDTSSSLYSFFSSNYPNVKIHVEGVSDTGMSPGSYVGGIGPGSTITSCNGATYTIRIAK